MQIETTVRKNSGSLQVTIPAPLVKWLKLEDGMNLIFQDEEGKHGKYFSAWKKQQND